MPHNSNKLKPNTTHHRKVSKHGASPISPALPRDIPDFDFDATKWRKSCNSSANIPAGYTYLAQLMGHDLGHTVAASSIPHIANSEMVNSYNRYNLTQNPLTLETIYGLGPLGSPHLYNARNFLFRIDESARLAPNESATPLLYDQRNRDTLMLHKMAVIWIQFHNRIARLIMLEDGHTENDHLNQSYYFEVFVKARSVVLKAWHDVLVNDLLKAISYPEAYALPDTDLDQIFLLDDVSVLNGIFRSFHALPLASYRLNSGQVSNFRLLGAGKQGERSNWRINWGYFFGEGALNKTGFSASYSHLFTALAGTPIMNADLASAILANPLHSQSEALKAAHAALPAGLKRDISATQLEQLFNNRAAGLGIAGVPKGAFINAPLFLHLMLEAQFYGENGGLGPFGSILLRRYLVSQISKIHYAKPAYPKGISLLGNIQDIIQFVETEEKEAS